VDLGEPKDGADRREQAEQKQAYDTGFLGGFDAQSKEQWDWQEDDNDVTDDREDGKTVERRTDGETSAGRFGFPCSFNLHISDAMLVSSPSKSQM
jgi:hypothetical protein